MYKILKEDCLFVFASFLFGFLWEENGLCLVFCCVQSSNNKNDKRSNSRLTKMRNHGQCVRNRLASSIGESEKALSITVQKSVVHTATNRKRPLVVHMHVLALSIISRVVLAGWNSIIRASCPDAQRTTNQSQKHNPCSTVHTVGKPTPTSLL